MTELTSLLGLVAADAPPEPLVSSGQLIAAALLGIIGIVVLITQLKLHPFLALTLGSLVVGGLGGLGMGATIDSFTSGFGKTAAGVGILVALGAMFGKLLADSGGADEIVDTIVDRARPAALPWAMAAVGAIIGLPMFFEIGLVLLMPVIYLVARRSGQSLIRIGIPALAGLSAMHGLVPPHPGPLAGIESLKADLGITLGLGVLVAVPTLIVAGPLFGSLAGRWVDVPAPATFEAREVRASRPGFGTTLLAVLLPVVLMMGKAFADILIADEESPLRSVLDFLGTPVVALLIALLAGMVLLGRGARMTRSEIMGSVESGLPPIAGIVMIVAAGGGFKQVLVDSGIGSLVADWVKGSGLSVLLVGWLVAVVIRLATGSATVATVTAAGIMAPLTAGLEPTHVSLLVLAIGAGSVFFSHVNDAGFWLVKEYFGLTVGQTLRTWSLMETILSVMGLVTVLAVSLIV